MDISKPSAAFFKAISTVPLLLVLWSVNVCASPASGVSEQSRGSDEANYCIGGIEDRKFILPSGTLQNAMKETPNFDCRSYDGRALKMPDLPEPSAALESIG
jgi:hypothetical protein